MPRDTPKVILFSTSLGCWEVWAAGRPLARASTWQALHEQHPGAMKPSAAQQGMADAYQTNT